jgi:hypothetical protein
MQIEMGEPREQFSMRKPLLAFMDDRTQKRDNRKQGRRKHR